MCQKICFHGKIWLNIHKLSLLLLLIDLEHWLILHFLFYLFFYSLYTGKTNRICHPVQTKKSQPEDKGIMPEFQALSIDLRVGISLSTLETIIFLTFYWKNRGSYNIILLFLLVFFISNIVWLPSPNVICIFCYDAWCLYSRTSMARTLMGRLPWLFRTLSWVPWKIS